MSSIALFYRSKAPSSLAPTSLLLVVGYDSGVNRTLRQRGFEHGMLVHRRPTTAEAEDIAGYTRYKMMPYDTWEGLIGDEENALASDPTIGAGFLEQCRAYAQDDRYRIQALPFKKRDLARQAKAAMEELDVALSEPLDASEKNLVREVAAALGVTQLDLFGQDYLLPES
jgi:hypothetical protein